MALRDEVVTLLDDNPGKQFASGEIQTKLKVGYPISNVLGELAHEKLIRKVSRGVYTSAKKKAEPTPAKPPMNGAPKGLTGIFQQEVSLSGDQHNVFLRINGKRHSMTWTKLVEVFVANAEA